MTLEEVAGKLSKAKAGQRNGLPKYVACCPAHEDKDPSFAIWEGADGWMHVKCQVGCSEESILAALGMTQADRRLKEPLYTNGKPVPMDYEYTDAQGQYLFTKRRTYENGRKKFLQLIKKDGQEIFTLQSLGTKSKTLYRLPEVLAQVEKHGTVYLCEGEKAVESLRKAGHVATCQPGGSGPKKWHGVHTAWLKGANVVIVADRDPREFEDDGKPKFNGEDYAREVFQALSSQTSASVVSSATVGDKHDAWDHLDAGHSVEAFVPRPDLEGKVVVRKLKSLAEVEPEEPKFLWDDWRYLRDEQCNILDAKGASGKTTLIIALAMCGSHGVSPMGGKCEPFTTLYYGNEDSAGEIRATYDEMGGNTPSRFVPCDEPFGLDELGAKVMADHLEEVKPRLVVLDPAKAYLPAGKAGEFDNPLVIKFYGTMRRLARDHHCTFLLVRHFTRYTKDRDMLDQGSGISAWFDCARSQIVMLKHPEKPRNSVVWHGRGSLRGAMLDAFGCGFSYGEYGFWKPTDEDLALFGMDEQGRKPNGRPATATAECEQMIQDFLRQGPRRVSDLLAEADRIGISRPTVYRTGDKLNVKRNGGVWKLHDPYDD